MNYKYKTTGREDIANEEYVCLICNELTYSHFGAKEHFRKKHQNKSGRFDISQGGDIEYCDDGEFIAFDEKPQQPSLLERMVGFLKTNFQSHYECEDSWYSCPKSDSCFNSHYEKMTENERPCYCGKDGADKLLAEYEANGGKL